MSSVERFNIFDARLKTPFSLIVAGPSNCGKTTFVIDLIRNSSRVLDQEFDYILWFYGETFPRDQYLRFRDVKFHQGLPESFDKFVDSNRRGLAVFDDLMSECGDNKLVSEFFTKRTHHENVSVIFITQNLFHGGKERKTFSKNATYLCIFNSPLDQTVSYSLARKLMPRSQKCFVDIFLHAVNKPHGYLFIDGHQESPRNAMFRTNLFGLVQHVFIPKNSKT